MRFFLKGLLAVPLLILFSCSAPVDIEGDVFLVKGDGKPQPSAAKEVIFVEGLSLEDILIKAYLESVSKASQENSLVYKELCNSSSKLQQSHILKLEEAVNKSIKEGKDKNIVDQEGSCSSLQEQFKSAKLSASENEERFNNLIASEQSKIDKANKKLNVLRKDLSTKIANKTEALYKEFEKGLVFDPRKGITNNTGYNIKLTGSMCLTFFNLVGDRVGTTEGCSSYSAKGILINASSVNLCKKDEFGFSKGCFLSKGERASYGSYYNRVSYCGRPPTPAEKLEYQRKGEKIPDFSKPDLTKGWKQVVPTSYSDDLACDLGGFRDNKEQRFIPVEDTVRTEKGNEIVYINKEINFGEIARRESYIERGQIKTQEKIIETAKKQIRKINKESNEDPAIAKSFNSEKLVLACTSHLDIIEEKKKEIKSRQSSLDATTKCDISEPKKLSDSFVLEKEGDIAKQKRLMNLDYSSIASLSALNVFADSPFRTSTNISGHYSLKEVPPGNYVIYSSYKDNFIEGIYLVNKEIKEGDAIDLSNANFLEIGSLANLLDVFYEKCSEKVCGEDDLRNSLNIREAERRYEDRKGELEELQESLERLKNLFN